jgi:cation diffusion facilitator family transporter
VAHETISSRAARGERTAQAGVLVNLALAVVKFLAGVLGNSYALVADAVESTADVFSSLIVWGGLRLSVRRPDERYPFGYGKAEPLAAAAVALLLLAAAAGVAIEAAREIRTPQQSPAPFTLAVLVGVVALKELLFRRVFRTGSEIASRAVQADAWHHRLDALTSLAAGIGIAVALAGGPGWEEADDWAALFAAAVIVANAIRIGRGALRDLMDRSPGGALVQQVAAAARAVPGVREVEKLSVRRSGLGLFVDIHVQADPSLTLAQAHLLGHQVKDRIQAELPQVLGALVHMEPYQGAAPPLG